MGDVLKVKELLEKHTPCTAQDYSFAFGGAGRTRRGVKELLDHDLKSGARGWLLKFNSVEELAKMWWLL